MLKESTKLTSILHPITPGDRATMIQMRSMLEPSKGKLRGIDARTPFQAIMNRVIAPDGVAFRPDTIGGVAGWWCEPADAEPDRVILHAHGGWFNWGSAESFRHLVGHIARSARSTAFVADYRLAPEAPFPAALNDLRACHRGLRESSARSVAVTGDSAGGNLALLLLALPDFEEKPIAAVALSPVTDLAMQGASWENRATSDPFFVRDQVGDLINAYLDGHNPRDGRASPLYGDLAGMPPVRIHVGDDEVLLDDSLRYVERAVASGVDAKVEVWEGMAHGFVGSVGRLDAASEALDAIGTFLSETFTDRARDRLV